MGTGRWRTIKRVLGVGTLCFILFGGVLLWQGCRSFGVAPDEARMVKLAKNSIYSDSIFHNPESLFNDWTAMMVNSFSGGKQPTPSEAIMTNRGPDFNKEPQSGLRLTWLGHSTVLIEIDGYRVITDPVWAERSSPFTWLGPARWYAPPIHLDKLPKIDAVVISCLLYTSPSPRDRG